MNEEKSTSVNQSKFKQEIGVFGGASMVAGIMIGSGIFYLGSLVLIRTGMNQGLSLICWVVAGIVSLLGGLCFAELGTSMPQAGGVPVYLTKAYHPILGFLSGFNQGIIIGPASNAGLAIAMFTALSTFVELSDTQIKIFAIALVVALTAVNYFGAKFGNIINNVSMVAKLIPIALIILAAIFVGGVSPDLSISVSSEATGSTGVIGLIAFGTVASLWAYDGWGTVNNITEEMKNPARDLPRALVIGIGGVTVLYTLFNYCLYRVLPMEKISELIGSGDLYMGTAAAESLFGTAGLVIVGAGMIIAILGSLNGCMLGFPRVYYAMAEEGHFFKTFSKTHPKYKTPTSCIILQGVLTIVLIVFRSLSEITNLVVFAGLLFNILTAFSVIVMRKRFPDMERPFKVPLYPVIPILSSLLFLALSINTLVEDLVTSLIGFIVIIIGALIYFAFEKKNSGSKA